MIMKKEDTFKILDPTQRPVEKDESELPGELLNGWHSIFAHLQSVVQAKPTDLFGQLLDQSRLYRGQLHAHLAQMQDRCKQWSQVQAMVSGASNGLRCKQWSQVQAMVSGASNGLRCKQWSQV
eukprot:656_1